MTKDIKIRDTVKIIEEAIKNNKIEFIANLIVTLQQDYIDLALLSTYGDYKENWTHTQTLDHITHEQRY
jgi:hypothetical protein